MPRDTPDTGIVVELPGREAGPFAKIGRRVLLALALITLVALVTYAGRDGYVDPEDDSISLLDAFYYSTVTITTTGYGDVRPATDEARLVTTIIVTPARVLFLILLVGTTLEILAERSRQAYRRARWRRSLDEHTIICGYGTKGRTAIRTLLGKGATAGQIVVIDERSDAASAAKADGYAVVIGDASQPRDARAGRDRARELGRRRGRPRRRRGPGHAHRPRAERAGDDRRRGARGGERAPAAPERRRQRRHLLGRRRAAARAVDRDAADHRAARGPAHRRPGARHRRARGRARGGRAHRRAAAGATRCCSRSSATAS